MTDNPIPGMRSTLIEAMLTMRNMRERWGPKAYGNSMPEYVREAWKDAPPDTNKVMVHPSSEQISRMEAMFDLINQRLEEDERRHLYQWARVQVSKRATIRGISKKLGMKEHEYRRLIDKIFQKLIVHWGSMKALRLFTPVEQAQESGQFREKSDVARPTGRGINGFQAEDGKPQHLPESGDHKRLITKMLKAGRKRDGAKPRPATG